MNISCQQDWRRPRLEGKQDGERSLSSFLKRTHFLMARESFLERSFEHPLQKSQIPGAGGLAGPRSQRGLELPDQRGLGTP